MPIVMRDDSGEPRVSFQGCVLYTGELNGYDDSDFYAIVWDAAAGRTRQIEYASTRYWSYDSGASVDATPDVVAAASEYVRAYALAQLRKIAEQEARSPVRNKHVRIVRGRKVSIGSTGEITWIGETHYGMRLRVRLDSGEEVFTSPSNVEVTDWQRYMPTEEVLAARAKSHRTNWRLPHWTPGYVVV